VEERIMKRIFMSALVVCLLVLSGSLAIAEEKARDKNWDFFLAPLYVWMVNMDGDLGIGPIDAGAKITRMAQVLTDSSMTCGCTARFLP